MSSLPKRNTFKLGFLFQDEVLVCQGKDPMKTLDTLGRLTKSFTLDPFLLWKAGLIKLEIDWAGEINNPTLDLFVLCESAEQSNVIQGRESAFQEHCFLTLF